MSAKILELQCDVKNPHPDRRSKDWHNLPVLVKGTRLIQRGHKAEDWSLTSTASYGWVHAHDPLAKMLVANSIQVGAKTWKELAVVHDCDFSAAGILEDLLTLGRIGPEDFVAVAEHANRT